MVARCQDGERNEPAERGCFFWSLAPFLLLFLVLMPFLVTKREPTAIVTLVALELFVLLVLIGLFNPLRFTWAWRGAAGLVFAGYVAYLVAMLIESGGRVSITPSQAEASAFNAICGLVAFGLPGLWFAIFGRLSLRAEVGGFDDLDESEEAVEELLFEIEDAFGVELFVDDLDDVPTVRALCELVRRRTGDEAQIASVLEAVRSPLAAVLGIEPAEVCEDHELSVGPPTG